MDWVPVKERGVVIGAIGFYAGKAVLVVSFFDADDNNRDGKVSTKERVTNYLIEKVTPFDARAQLFFNIMSIAGKDLEVVRRDAGFATECYNMQLGYAAQMVSDAATLVYLKPAIKKLALPLSMAITKNPIKQFVIRKGMSKLAEQAIKASVGM